MVTKAEAPRTPGGNPAKVRPTGPDRSSSPTVDRSRSTERTYTTDRRNRQQSPASSNTGLLVPGRQSQKDRESSGERVGESRPAGPPKPTRSSSREVVHSDESASRSVLRTIMQVHDQIWEKLSNTEHKVAVVITIVGLVLVVIGLVGMVSSSRSAAQDNRHGNSGTVGSGGSKMGHLRHRPDHHSQFPQPGGHPGGQPHINVALPECSDMVPCPVEWRKPGSKGGFFCLTTGKCNSFHIGRFADCKIQCHIGSIDTVPLTPPSSNHHQTGGGGAVNTVIVIQGGASTDKDKALTPLKLEKAGAYDLRVKKGNKMLGCAAPIGLFPGQPKYGCAGEFATAQTCDAANFPVKDTKYVAAVHEGCETRQGRGTYGYAYDDGVGLKQCAPVTKYEWVLCPTGEERGISWEADAGHDDTTKRFRVTNKCEETVWIQQAGAEDAILKHDDKLVKLEPSSTYTYSIPNRGFPSTRFLPKTGCAHDGNDCDIQSMPPCPEHGCDLPVDTKFEASWGCVYATGVPDKDHSRCALTGQGNPSTYQDWWDGSAVDGWTLPFSVLVDDAGHGLAPGDDSGSPSICGPVVCADLKAEQLCPGDEYLTPDS